MKEANIQQEKRLGRGLSALLGESKAKKSEDLVIIGNNDAKERIEMIAVNKIVAGIYQPRKYFDSDELADLAKSIKENGVIQPIIVRKADDEDHYEVIAGERRLRASRIANLEKIPAIVKKINNHEALELAIIENVQRSDLSLVEEANGYKQLLEEFLYTQDQVAKRVGKSRSHVANLLRILNLPKSVQDLLDKKTISMGHARAIINSDDPEKLAKKIVESSLTVRNTEDLAREEKIEKIKNTPVLIRTESKIKFINNDHLLSLESELAEVLASEVKISYNSLKNSGKIVIKFDELEKIYSLIEKLKN